MVLPNRCWKRTSLLSGIGKTYSLIQYVLPMFCVELYRLSWANHVPYHPTWMIPFDTVEKRVTRTEWVHGNSVLRMVDCPGSDLHLLFEVLTVLIYHSMDALQTSPPKFQCFPHCMSLIARKQIIQVTTAYRSPTRCCFIRTGMWSKEIFKLT